MPSDWSVAQIGDQAGKTVLITGASSGIGLEAARLLANAGAQVVLACRNPEKAQAAVREIEAERPRGGVEGLTLDLASLASVRAAAARFCDRHRRLDILCNSAGLMAIPRASTAEGWEMQLGVNHLGHFALTGLLMPLLLQGTASRIVTVTSFVHRFGKIRFDDLDWERSYDKWEAYFQSKLANLLFADELGRRLHARGARAISVGCHPGLCNTNLHRVGPELEGARLSGKLLDFGWGLLGQSATQGAWPLVFAATAPDVLNRDCIGPTGLGGLRGPPDRVRTHRVAHDVGAARGLWKISARRTGIDFLDSLAIPARALEPA